MIKNSLIVIFALFFNNTAGFSQETNVADSLINLLNHSNDSAKINTYIELCWNLRNSEPEKASIYGNKAIQLAKKIESNEGLVKAYSFTGVAYRNLGNYSKAFDYYFQGLELAKTYDIPEQQGYAYINLGNLYLYQKNHIDAIINLKNALAIGKSISNDEMVAYCYLNLGRAQLINGNSEIAKEHFISSLDIRKAFSDVEKIAVSYKYLGDVYASEDSLEQAMKYYNQSIQGINMKKDLDLLADVYNKKAFILFKKKQYERSKRDALKSLQLSEQVGSKLRIRNAHQTLADIYMAIGNYQKAALNLDFVIKLNDSLFNKELSEKIWNIQYSMEQERKQIEINLLNVEKQNQRSFIVFLGIALLLGALFLIISFRLNLLRKKANELLERQKADILLKNEELNNQNEEIQTIADSLTEANIEISLQKEEIEKSHEQITSSINYAKRIQTAILPDKDSLDDLFSDHLVFFQAKNIVSGDFYWIKKIGNYRVVAVADCTGHGVPGSFLSMLGITLLNEIVRRVDIVKASEILNELRTQVKSALSQTGKHFEHKDGMDLAICVIDGKNKTIQYSGANNPIYLIRKRNNNTAIDVPIHKKIIKIDIEAENNHDLIELKPDRQPIGSYIKEIPFNNIELKYKKDDSIFLFSDGYYDQFHGETGKKFNNGRFRKLLISLADKKMADQQEILLQNFTNWKMDKEQVDDVLVLGIKL